ncbi:PaaI family thioesterase [Streptomyces longispororuber]|uniref:PaaI family thioesterase n=1 Tax=Streptomyces TaxID=1883 RepID=UPI0024A8F2ED|nr:PaaI family thioesterase [Streptomyces sp. CC224B]
MTSHHGQAPAAEQVLALMPFAALLGIRAEQAEPHQVVLCLPWAAERCTAGGVLHGGALVALADSAAGMCAYLNLPEGASTSTIELKTNFFAAVRGGEVRAVAAPLHLGGSVAVIQTDLFHSTPHGQRHRVGQTTQTQAILRPR